MALTIHPEELSVIPGAPCHPEELSVILSNAKDLCTLPKSPRNRASPQFLSIGQNDSIEPNSMKALRI
jgi:hypothetical protein